MANADSYRRDATFCKDPHLIKRTRKNDEIILGVSSRGECGLEWTEVLIAEETIVLRASIDPPPKGDFAALLRY